MKKRIALFLAVTAILLSVVSCGNKKQQAPQPETPSKPVYTFTKADTTDVMTLASQFIARLENKDVRGAVDMLNYLSTGDSIQPLSPTAQRRQAMALNHIMGVRFDLNRLILRTNTDNEVKIDVTLFDKQFDDPKPNKTTFHLRPVKFEGKWYLTVWDNISNTNQDINKD